MMISHLDLSLKKLIINQSSKFINISKLNVLWDLDHFTCVIFLLGPFRTIVIYFSLFLMYFLFAGNCDFCVCYDDLSQYK